MGSLFTGMAEAGEQTGHRWRTMLWTTMWLFLATLLGGLLTDALWLGLIATALVAAGSGLAGSASPRAGLIALFALVNFTVYFGGPDTVLSRILGTFAGLLVVIAYIDWVHAQGQWLVPLTALAGGLAVLFITSNYLFSVIGTTTLIVTVLYMDGDKLSSTAPLRLGETIVAGIIAIAALAIWPDKKMLPEAASAPN